MNIWRGCAFRQVAGYYEGYPGIIVTDGFKGFVRVLRLSDKRPAFSSVFIALKDKEDIQSLIERYNSGFFVNHLSSYEEEIIDELLKVNFSLGLVDLTPPAYPPAIVYSGLSSRLRTGDFLIVHALPY